MRILFQLGKKKKNYPPVLCILFYGCVRLLLENNLLAYKIFYFVLKRYTKKNQNRFFLGKIF